MNQSIHNAAVRIRRGRQRAEDRRFVACGSLWTALAWAVLRTAVLLGATVAIIIALLNPAGIATWGALAVALVVLYSNRKGPDLVDLWLTRDAAWADDNWADVYGAADTVKERATPPPPVPLNLDRRTTAPPITPPVADGGAAPPVDPRPASHLTGTPLLTGPCEYPGCPKPRGHDVEGWDHSTRIAALGEVDQL